MTRLAIAFIMTIPLLGCSKNEPVGDTSPATAVTPTSGTTDPSAKADKTSDPKDGPMAIYELAVNKLGGDASSLAAHKDKAILVVNVASKCGLTPQYEGLEKLQKKYGERGFTVVGFPCNQFGGQEPGSADEIKTFCTSNYGVSFPMYEKIEVNGPGRHPIYTELTKIKDADGEAGDIKWNFEKFLIAPGGSKVTRFRPQTTPEDPAVIAAIEAALAK